MEVQIFVLKKNSTFLLYLHVIKKYLTSTLMYNSKIDKFIFESFINGDEKSFSIIFNAYHKYILRRILYVVRDEEHSMDIMQQIFVKLWNKRLELNISYENFDSYLNKMISSFSIDHLRKNIKEENLIAKLSKELVENEKSTEDNYLYKESLLIIEEAINTLPPQRKQIFTLCRLEGKSYFEVSELLGISVSTVSNQLVSATKSIRSYATKQHFELKLIIFIIFF